MKIKNEFIRKLIIVIITIIFLLTIYYIYN